MKNIIKFELKRVTKSTITWTIALIAIGGFYISVFPMYHENMKEIKEMLSQMPEALLAAFGMDPNMIFALSGFLGFVIGFLALAAVIQALNLGIVVFSRENKAKANAFLYTRPLSRNRIYTAKLITVLTAIVATNIVLIPTLYISGLMASSEGVELSSFLLVVGTIGIMQLCFGSIGMLVGSAVTKMRSIVGTSLGIAFGFYGIGMLYTFTGEDKFKLLSPFKYFDYERIYTLGHYEVQYLFIIAAIILGCVIGSYVLVNRKDVPEC